MSYYNYYDENDRQWFGFPFMGGGMFGPPPVPPGGIKGPDGQPGPGFQPGFPGQQPGSTPGIGGPPASPPPSFIPPQQPQIGLQAVDPGAIRGCLYRYTYLWLDNRQRFWFYPTYVGRRSVSGYRWTGFFWVYYGVDLERINSFQCY
ncbi:hypothetical protein GCM10008935_00940 [Alkalibacillus silvisoli]|uniref:Transporter n=1 Tax=Alkalibacillus silvisoli TaxID=392823 RepID=A0ABP3JDP4_9BACI